jgi:integrase
LEAVVGQAQDEWWLDFYDFSRDLESVEDLVPGLGDVHAWARRNGARHGTPILLDPSGRADVRVNAFWRAPQVRGLAVATQRRYAFSLKMWLEFLRVVEVPWDRATALELAAFKQWRLSVEDNPQVVAPGSFRVDLAALRRFYMWAADCHGVDNPIRLHRTAQVLPGRERVHVLEATPAGIRRADVKWLTPLAFRQWRNLGLCGFTTAGLPDPRWRGRTEDRDVAFVEGLFDTGLRLGEWSSILTGEVPAGDGRGLVRGRLAAACAKGAVGRWFWARAPMLQRVRVYVEEGSRRAAVTQAQREGHYERVKDRWLVREVGANGVLRVADGAGTTRRVTLDALPLPVRMRLFTMGPDGLEPLWLWLNRDGTPRPKQAWHKTFARANTRVAKALSAVDGQGRLWARPHMLRHSFALRWYAIVTFLAWQRTAMLTEAERRDFRNQLGDVWFLLATLLGHRSAETTRQVYLEPFQAVQVEQVVALLNAEDRAALDRLAAVLAVGHPQVLTSALG